MNAPKTWSESADSLQKELDRLGLSELVADSIEDYSLTDGYYQILLRHNDVENLRDKLSKLRAAPPAIPVVGVDLDPQLDRSWGRLPVTVASGGGACGDTIRMVYEGLCGLSALIEWSEGDRVVRHPVLIETFVQLDDLSPVLVGEMLYDVNYEPTGTKVFLRFSAIRSVEVS